MNNTEEMWFPITEAPDYYISNRGRVMSGKTGKPKILKPLADGARYCLRIDGKRVKFSTNYLLQVFKKAKTIEKGQHS